MTRIDIDTYMMLLAHDVSKRSTCPRARVGAILSKREVVLSTGYNGSPSKTPHCEDEGAGCILDLHGKCIRTIHAEANALLKMPTNQQGMTLYVTHLPCVACCHLIINLKIARVVYNNFYLDPRIALFDFQDQIMYLNHSNICVDHLASREKNDIDSYISFSKNPGL